MIVAYQTLTIPIYDCKVNVVVTPDFEDAVAEAGWRGNAKDGDGICLHYPDAPKNFTIVLRTGAISPGNIAHEALHLTIKICDALDIKIDERHDEAACYLIGFIVDGITQIIEDGKRREGNQD